MLQRIYTRVAKPAARYTDRGSAAEHCSACRFFMSGGDCARVLGRVMPGGWCKYFSQEAVQRWNPLWPMAGIPAPPGATLDLSFLTSGALDPRITFTRASTATYTNYAGVMQTAAVNAPRWDYNPSTLALQGLLIEEARTNILQNSSNMAAGTWNTTAVTVTAGQAGAPDGTATMGRIAEDSTTNIHYLSQLPILVASTTYVFSVFAKMQQTRWLQLFLDNSAAVGGYATFDLQSGVISGPLTALGAGVIGTASIQAVGAGIYRCSIATTIGASTSGRAGFVTSNAPAPGWVPSYTGNPANGLLLWGAQLEQGTFPTSYIPTAGAAVTRAADVATVPVGAWYNAAASSIAAEAVIPTANVTNILFSLCDPSGGNNRLQASLSPGRLAQTTLTSGGTNSLANPELSFLTTDGVVFKFGSSLQTGQYLSCLNGVAPYSATAGIVMPAGVTQLALGVLVAGNIQQLDGYLRRVTYWPRALSNTELQSVTT